MGNPTTFTKEAADEIVERLSAGEPLEWICRDESMPAVRTVSHWRKANADFDQAFLAARDHGFDAIAAGALNIADTPCEGIVEKLERVPVYGNADKPEEITGYELQVVETRREDMLGHRKLQVETRLKLLAKWDPRRYGDRLAVDHGVQDSLAEKLKAARERAGIR